MLERERKVSKEEFSSKLQILKDQIEGRLSKLDAKKQKYKELIQELQREEKRRAEEKYEQYANKENNYLSVIINATVAFVRIKRELLIEETSAGKQDKERVRNSSESIKLPWIMLPMYERNSLK